MYDAKQIASLTGVDFDAIELRILSLLAAQRDRFEAAYAQEGQFDLDMVRALRKPDTGRAFDYSERLPFVRGAWHGWKLKERYTGNDPFIGFMLEAANEGELAAYDYGCRSCEGAVRRVLDGIDTGAGSTNEPWASLRKRLLELVAENKQLKLVGWE